VSFLVVAQSSSEVLEGLMNNPVFARAVAENKQLLGYEFTLETCENARS
jgi:hypothetical protein